MNTGTPPRAENKETLDFLLEELGEECQRRLELLTHNLNKSVNLNLEKEIGNVFPEEYELDCTQRIDYVFRTEKGFPQLYLELESLDGAQLMRFSDGAFNSRDEWNKLWYYYGT